LCNFCTSSKRRWKKDKTKKNYTILIGPVGLGKIENLYCLIRKKRLSCIRRIWKIFHFHQLCFGLFTLKHFLAMDEISEASTCKDIKSTSDYNHLA